ncbi:uncharacterized protein FIBRA_06253 [Fibroporia radiculosa]|uniref:Lysophospholipase n=1 Tax=Fibroporia radiculosa TaxID=599839 RepID=J4H3Z3_9APHY|nr:uncharacterized protein FIBRA_06253 [Fibroporia radiculosa]CCM04094.1 predicted protein [Fibroporia radiculosa]
MPGLVISFLLTTLVFAWPVASQVAAAAAYAPTLTPCPPGTSLVRHAGTGPAQSVSTAEAAYISSRRSQVLPSAWAAYLANVQANLNASHAASLPSYVSDILSGSNGSYPGFGIATSGGGYRAAIVGAGVLNALDGRNTSSAAAGTGGLLQSATYLAGLSGGSWLVTSLAQANFPTLPDLIFGPSNTSSDAFGGWLAQLSFATPSSDAVLESAYVDEVIAEVSGKLDAGFPVSVTDVWARVLSRHFVNGTSADNFFDPLPTHGAGITFSSISGVPTFASRTQPFPIIVADSLSPNGNDSAYFQGAYVPLTNPVYEFNVYEMGSFDPTLAAFTPMEYLGSPGNSVCATGFDQACFMTATSSNVFNSVNLTELLPPALDPILTFLADLSDNGTTLDGVDTARYPNPFYGVQPRTFIDSNETVLSLVDGGDDGVATPYMPLLAKARGIDVILAIDAAADTDDNWAAGVSLMAMQDRVSYYPTTYSFPPVPTSTSVMLSQNLTKRPTFFGCNSSLESSEPLIIYIANGGPPLDLPPLTNTSTLQLAYPADQIDGMLSESFDFATQGIPNGRRALPVQWLTVHETYLEFRGVEFANSAWKDIAGASPDELYDMYHIWC